MRGPRPPERVRRRLNPDALARLPDDVLDLLAAQTTRTTKANVATALQMISWGVKVNEFGNALLDENGEFEKEIDTGSTSISKFKVPGSVRLKAYIDRTTGVGAVSSSEDDDGTTAVLMKEGTLDAELSVTTVALGDDFWVRGTAPGTDTVAILSVDPKGGGGDGINNNGAFGIVGYSASVSDTDNSFEKKISTSEDATSGTYLIGVLSPGRDGKYGKTNKASIYDAFDVYLGAVSYTHLTLPTN